VYKLLAMPPLARRIWPAGQTNYWECGEPRMDAGAAGAAGGNYPQLETVGAVHRTPERAW